MIIGVRCGPVPPLREETPMSEDTPSRQKFKWTKELVNIALNDGMTQEEIARVCRTTQSVVSSWKNGKSKAKEQQLAELLRRYGARLNRTTARVYLVCEEPTGKWEETDVGRSLLALLKRRVALDAEVEEHRKADAARKKAEIEAEQARRRNARDAHDVTPFYGHITAYQYTVAEQEAYSQLRSATKELGALVAPYAEWDNERCIERLIDLFKADFAAQGPQRIVQIEGSILFRYTFCMLVGRAYRRGLDIGREPICRWVVHDLSRGKFRLVIQERRHLVGTSKVRWDAELDSAKQTVAEMARHDSKLFVPPFIPSETVECADDAGRWRSTISEPMTAEELIKTVGAYIADPKTLHNPHDEHVLPYLLRKALIEHGYPVAGVERITGLE